jgi:hypothetical protein
MSDKPAQKGLLDKLIDEYGTGLKEKLDDPVFFIEEVIYKPKGWTLFNYAKEWLRICQKYKRVNITAFRSSSKTETLLIAQAIWRAFRQKNFMGAIISASLPQSTEVLKRIKMAILDNEVLRTSIPSGKASAWSKTEIEFKNGSRILCKPYNDNIRGYHLDWVGLDEIGEYRDHDILMAAILPTLVAKNGDVNAIGTPTSKIDLIHKLRDNKAWYSKIYPAYTTDYNLFKERYPNREIVKYGHKIKIVDAENKNTIYDEYDSYTWSREFMCVPLSDADKIFPLELIEQSYDYSRRLTHGMKTYSQYYVGIDFALSGESGADFTVIVVLERDKENRLIVCEIEKWKGYSYNKQKIMIAQLLKSFKPVRSVLDESSFGASFIDDLRRDVSGTSIEGFKFSSGPYSNRKQDLITMLRSTLESNFTVFTDKEKLPKESDSKMLLIPRDKTDMRTMTLTTQLTDELLSFGMKYDETKHTVKFEGIGTHDDMVIAFALANFAAYGAMGMRALVNRSSTGYMKSHISRTR